MHDTALNSCIVDLHLGTVCDDNGSPCDSLGAILQSHLPCECLPERSIHSASATHQQTRSSSFSSTLLMQHNCHFLGFANILQRWTAAVVRLPCATTIGTSYSFQKIPTYPSRSTGLPATFHETKVSYLFFFEPLTSIRRGFPSVWLMSFVQMAVNYLHCERTSGH